MNIPTVLEIVEAA